jgi:hypothetical protein
MDHPLSEMTMHPENEDEQARHRRWLEKKAELLEEIESFEYQLFFPEVKCPEFIWGP